jgi:hypothetical protein
MRRDDLYLDDIIEAADHVAAFLSGTDFEGFLAATSSKPRPPETGVRIPLPPDRRP